MKCVHKKRIFSAMPGRLLFLPMCSVVLFLGLCSRAFAIGEQVEHDRNDYVRTESEIELPDSSLDNMSGWIDIAEFNIPKGATQTTSYNRCNGMSPCVSGAHYFKAGAAWITLPGAQWTPFIKFTPQEVNVGDGKAWVSAYVAGNKKVVLHREEQNATSGNLVHYTSNAAGQITFPEQPTQNTSRWEGNFVTASSKCGANAQGRCVMRDATYFDASSDFTIKVALKFTKIPSGISKSGYVHNINSVQLFEFGHITSDVNNTVLGTYTASVSFTGGIRIPDRCLISSDKNGELRFNDIAIGAADGLHGTQRVKLETTCKGLASSVNQYIKVTRKSGTSPVDQRYQIFAMDKNGNPALTLAMKIIPGGNPPSGLGYYCTEAAGNYNEYGKEYLVTQGGIAANLGTQTRYDLIDFALCKTGIPANYGEYTIPITITTRWSDK